MVYDFLSFTRIIALRGHDNLRNALFGFRIVVENTATELSSPDILYRMTYQLSDFVIIAMLSGGVGHFSLEWNILAYMAADIDGAADVGIIMLKSTILFEKPLCQGLF